LLGESPETPRLARDAVPPGSHLDLADVAVEAVRRWTEGDEQLTERSQRRGHGAVQARRQGVPVSWRQNAAS